MFYVLKVWIPCFFIIPLRAFFTIQIISRTRHVLAEPPMKNPNLIIADDSAETEKKNRKT